MTKWILAVCVLLTGAVRVFAQGGNAAPIGRTGAPIDLTGYWTAVITEDWHQRMLTAPKGDFGTGEPGAVLQPGGSPGPSNIPYNAPGRQQALAWDPARDEAEGNQCKAYGAPGVMRLPTHLRIGWQDERTLKVEADAGTQERLFHIMPAAEAANARPPAGQAPSWQGYSAAFWTAMGGRGSYERGGSLTVVTTGLKPGYYWKNGMPYSGNAKLTEHFRVIDLPDSGKWIVFSSIVEDPEYLTQPYVVTYHFKRLPDGSRWKPQPCSAR